MWRWPRDLHQKYQIDAVHELPVNRFDEALKACRDFGARGRKRQSVAKIAVKAKLDDVEVFQDIEQGTPEWLELRRGCCTASNFAIICVRQGRRAGITWRKLLHTMAGEILTGEVAGAYRNAAMDRGNLMEDEAARMCMVARGFANLARVGFIKRAIHNPQEFVLRGRVFARLPPSAAMASWKSRRCAPT